MELVEECYRLTRSFPAAERYGLTSQLRRAAISVPANIAGGNGLAHRAQFVELLCRARGSAREVDTLLEVAVRIGIVSRDQTAHASRLAESCSRMVSALITKLRA